MGKVHELPGTVNKQLLLHQLVTLNDLQELKAELLISFKRLLDATANQPVKKWLKSYEVEEMLGISSNTLLTWRNNGTLPYSPLGGIYYYDPEDIENLLQARKKGNFKIR
jgi:hypothetical protein